MITIPPQIPQNVQKIHVSSKDPHHELNKDKKKKHDEQDDVEDKITLSGEDDPNENQGSSGGSYSPMQGHIDIDV